MKIILIVNHHRNKGISGLQKEIIEKIVDFYTIPAKLHNTGISLFCKNINKISAKIILFKFSIFLHSQPKKSTYQAKNR